MSDNNTYKVKDLYLSAYIYASQKPLLRVEREGSTCWFVYGDKASCEALASAYWANTAVGNVKAIVDAIRSLKDLVFAQR